MQPRLQVGIWGSLVAAVLLLVSPAAIQAAYTDVDILQFALNLEVGLPSCLRMDASFAFTITQFNHCAPLAADIPFILCTVARQNLRTICLFMRSAWKLSFIRGWLMVMA